MTDQNRKKKIAEIRESLEKATPGPWKFEMRGEYEPWACYGSNGVEIMNFGTCPDVYDQTVGTPPSDVDEYLIANAPEWLHFLLSELEREREENRKLREERDEWGRTAQEAINTVFVREHQLQSAQQDKEKLIEGLRTILNYASEDGVHWKLDRCYTTARDTLKAVGVKVDS